MMAGDEARSILVVDDDDTFRDRLVRALSRRGYDARGCKDIASAQAAARSESPELAVVDLRLESGSGLDVVRALRHIDPTTSILVLTGYGSIATAVDAMRLGAVHYLTKPADVDQILAAFEPEARDAKDGREGSSPPPSIPSLARVEWEHIHRVLGDCAGNVSQAARLLGVHRRSLQRKLAKYPVRR